MDVAWSEAGVPFNLEEDGKPLPDENASRYDEDDVGEIGARPPRAERGSGARSTETAAIRI